MAFNFGSLANNSGVASVRRRLKPWDIYEVELEDAHIDDVQGTKDPSMTYRILKVRFSNEQGYYEESIFFPKDGDEKRPTRTVTDKNGTTREVEMASSLERTEMFIAQVSAVFNPEAYKRLQQYAAEGKLKDFDTVAKFFVEKVCKPTIGKKTSLKLIGRADKDGNIQPTLPYFVNVNRKGEAYISDNFIGENLFFSDYEETKRKEYLNAKPTDMKKTNPVVDEVPSSMESSEKDELNSMLDDLA